MPAERDTPAEPPPLVPGTKVRLAPPDGFTKADAFTGYQHEATGGSVVVIEIPGPYAETSAAFANESKLREQGMRVIEATERDQGSDSGRILHIEQSVPQATVQKWVWVFGNADATVLVMGTCVEQYCNTQLDGLRASVTSAIWDRTAGADPLDDLGFALKDTGGLRLAGRLANMLSYTDSGKSRIEADGVAFMIGPALGSGPIADRRAFVETRVQALPLEDLKVESIEPVSIDGLDGFELVGTHREGDVAQLAYVAIVFEESNYWMAFGRAPLSKRATWLKVFRAMAASLTRDRPA